MSQHSASRSDRDDDDDLAAQAARLEALAAELRAKLERRDAPADPDDEAHDSADDAAAEGPVVLDITRSPTHPGRLLAKRSGQAARPEPAPRIQPPKEPVAPKAKRDTAARETATREPAPRESTSTEAADREASLPRGKSGTGAPKINLKLEDEQPEDDGRWQTKLLLSYLALRGRLGKAGVVSMVIHAVLLVGLGIFTFAAAEKELPFMLEASNSESDSSTPLQQLEQVKVDMPTEQIETVTPVQTMSLESMIDPTPMPLQGKTADAEVGSELAAGKGALALGGMGMGSLMSELPKGPPAPKVTVGNTTFFGVSRKGNKFAYVVDNSASMRGPQFEAARNEVFRSISNMNKQQSFYVIYFSDRAYPMFDPEVEPAMLPAGVENFKKLQAWLAKIEVSKGGRIFDAMEIALKMEPDAIFLLSDGEMSEWSVDKIISLDTKGKSINTIGFESKEGALNLKKIADKHNGVFQFFPQLR